MSTYKIIFMAIIFMYYLPSGKILAEHYQLVFLDCSSALTHLGQFTPAIYTWSAISSENTARSTTNILGEQETGWLIE